MDDPADPTAGLVIEVFELDAAGGCHEDAPAAGDAPE